MDDSIVLVPLNCGTIGHLLVRWICGAANVS